jgi:ABC-type multidrug transport system fused ATPase/permease subunit
MLNAYFTPRLRTAVVLATYKNLARCWLEWFDQHLAGQQAVKLTDLQNAIYTLLIQFPRLLTPLFKILFYLGYITLVSGLVGYTGLITFAFYALITWFFLHKQFPLEQKAALLRQNIGGLITDALTNIFQLKISSSIDTHLTQNFTPALKNWQHSMKKANYWQSFSIYVTELLALAIYFIPQIVLAAYLFSRQELSIDKFLIIIFAAHHIPAQLKLIYFNLFIFFFPQLAIAKSSFHYVTTAPIEFPDYTAPNLFVPRGEIIYQNVTCRYLNGPPILKNFSLTIKAYEKVGLIGSSGTGKTTITRALLHYFPLVTGKILIDKQDLNSVNPDSVRQQIALVPQNIRFLQLSVYQTLQLIKPTASRTEIYDACKLACIHSSLIRLPQGYDTTLGQHGACLSSGQKQRLALACAFLKQAPILILDEFSSAIDYETVQLLEKNLDLYFKKHPTTAFIITNQTSLLQKLDKIVLLHQGVIAASGTHSELEHSSQLYRNLVM